MNIYIHIPFCTQKCTYCKFAITPIFNDFKKKKYLSFLKQEIISKLQKYGNQKIDTIYFGGGTPSILSIQEVKELLKLFPDGEKEITIECNPEDISEEYIAGLINIGINRISIGVQSLNEETLAIIQRSKRIYIEKALDSIKNVLEGKVGNNILFGNKKISINIDLIIGLPKQKRNEILQDLKFLHQKYPFITHSSVYILEKGIYPKSWKQNTMTESDILEEYNDICNFFRKKGWNHYEVSNFSKPGYESKHNSGYWNHADSLGLGLSASSGINTPEGFSRWSNNHSFKGYYNNQIIEKEFLNEEQKEIEKLLFGLRTKGYTTNEEYTIINIQKVKELIEKGILKGNEKEFSVSEKNFSKIDWILDYIIQ